jgi:outer membrane protein assembly factor BamB
VASPVFHNNRLLISGLMFELDLDKPAGKVLWTANQGASRRILSNTSTPLLRGEHAYSARSSGQLVCVEAATGRQIWETDKVTDLKSGASIHVTPVGDTVYLFTDRGDLVHAELTPQGYKEFGRARLIEPTYPFGGRNVVWPPPAYSNRHVFVRSDKELVCASLLPKG